METIITFLLKSIFISGLFCCIYALLLKDRRLHNYNRFFLLFSLYASIQIPLLQINRPESGAKLSATFQIPEMMFHSRNAAEDLTENINRISPSYYSPAAIIIAILLFISICLLSALMIRIIKIRQLGKNIRMHVSMASE